MHCLGHRHCVKYVFTQGRRVRIPRYLREIVFALEILEEHERLALSIRNKSACRENTVELARLIGYRRVNALPFCTGYIIFNLLYLRPYLSRTTCNFIFNRKFDVPKRAPL